jgi:hypothetical protein
LLLQGVRLLHLSGLQRHRHVLHGAASTAHTTSHTSPHSTTPHSATSTPVAHSAAHLGLGGRRQQRQRGTNRQCPGRSPDPGAPSLCPRPKIHLRFSRDSRSLMPILRGRNGFRPGISTAFGRTFLFFSGKSIRDASAAGGGPLLRPRA